MSDINPIFIEASKLGSVVEAKVRQIIVISDKRKRAREMKKLCSLLRFLAIAPTEIPERDGPTGMALGVRSDGELGLWLIYDSATNIRGNIA
jgi:hypothetical protein